MYAGRALPAFLCLLAGGAAAAIAAAWLIASRSRGFEPPLPEDLTDYGALTVFWWLAVAFKLVLPAAAMLSAGAGILAWRHPVAIAGLLCTAFAIAIYLLSAIAMGQSVQMREGGHDHVVLPGAGEAVEFRTRYGEPFDRAHDGRR